MAAKQGKARTSLESRIRELTGGSDGFHGLMQRRVLDILLVASHYDAYVLEGEDHLSELLLTEYLEMNLRYPPRVRRVGSADEALRALDEKRYDLVLTMSRVKDVHAFLLGERIKEQFPDIPVVLVTSNTRELNLVLEKERPAGIDRIFFWQGDINTLVAIVKLIEDSQNAEHDIKSGGVQAIILIEDSVGFYSAYLPLIYTEIMKQTQRLITEGLSLAQRVLRQSARPKIFLATTYEEAREYYGKYRENLLGIISDVSFPRGGAKDDSAGIDFIRPVRKEIPDLPVLFQSSYSDNKKLADEAGAHFIHKLSPTLLHELREFILAYFGFGDFVFRMPDGAEVARAADLRTLIEQLPAIPVESIRYHASRNHFSKWLKARTEFRLAEMLRPITIDEFDSVEEVREFLIRVLTRFRTERQRGVVIDFNPESFDRTSTFTRIGGGSLGGKAHNLAFINRMPQLFGFDDRFPGVRISLPLTAVLTTDVFDRFMVENGLDRFVEENAPDEEIDGAFLRGQLPDEVVSSLRSLLAVYDFPLAIRSSSLLEDSQHLPFAGVYTTMMLPNNHPDSEIRLLQLLSAVKLVYASTFHSRAKRYIRSTPHRVEEEKMAVIVQELIGQRYGEYFYPLVSGAAKSHNYYAIEKLRPESGVANIALGLGKYVVEGGNSWRFCPIYPKSPPPFDTADKLAAITQRSFLALQVGTVFDKTEFLADENLETLDLSDAEQHGSLAHVASTFSADNDMLFDGISKPGLRIVTFAHILKNSLFPLAEVVHYLLSVGSEAMGGPVEIEFAASKPEDAGEPVDVALLQIRKLVTPEMEYRVSLSGIAPESIFCLSESSLGNGIIDGVCDIVYVRPEDFDPACTLEIAKEIRAVNDDLAEKNRQCILIGPGRWGSSDRWLGVPVAWEDISQARILVEVNFDNFRVEPSQGTHFFHNITAFEIGYLTVQQTLDGSFIDWDWLASFPAARDERYIRHIRLLHPVKAYLDGINGRAAIVKPSAAR